MKNISVIIPVYNSGKYIYKCLSSILSQTYKNFEIICVDDGSTDNSKEIILDLAKDNKNIAYFYEENSGPSYARNNGIKHAKGEYITFIDSDDYLTDENCFQDCISQIGDNDIIIFDVESSEKRIRADSVFFDFIVVNQLWATCGKIVKRSCITKLFNEDTYVGEDLKFWFDNSENIKTFKYNEKKYYNYEPNQESIMRSKKVKKEITNYFDDLYDILTKSNNEYVYAKLLELYADTYLYFVRFDEEGYTKSEIYYKRFKDIYKKIKKNKLIKIGKKIKIYIKNRIFL